MLAQDVRINRARRHTCFGSYSSTKPCRIEKSTAANDLILRQPGVLEREIGQYVDRVSYQQEDGRLFQRLHVIDHAAKNVLIATDKICP